MAQNKDPEGLGRVKVHFPWRADPDESHWARIAVPMPEQGQVLTVPGAAVQQMDNQAVV